MVSEALDGLTDEQLADLELQESGLVSGQNEGAIASTPFAQRMNPAPAPAQEPEEPVALSDYELNKLEEENYRRTDYVMTPQEFDQYWDRRDKEDNEVGRFLDGLGQGAAGLVGMVPDAANEISGALIRGVQDPIRQAKQNIQTGAEIIRKGGINLVQLFDWVSNKYDDLATGSKRAEAINAGIRLQLEADGRLTGDRERDEQIYQAALVEAREAGAYKPTMDQVREDRGKAYERYVREKSLERDFAAVTDFKTGESQMSAPTSAEDYQITDEKALPTVSTLGSMVVDPVNLIPMGAGALSKARVLRRIANLSEKPLLGAERVASGLADTAERIELGISTRLQDITGLTSKQQAALGAGMAGTAVYVDSATEGGGGLTKAVMMAGGILPTLHYGGALLRKVGSAAGGTATIVREAGVGGLGVARAEAASNLAGNAAVPERYRKFFTGYVDGTDSTLKRVAQNADNPEALRRVSRFADRMGATQVARVADDAVSGAVTAGIVGTPFAALQPDAERAGEVMGGILALGGAGGVVGGLARRAGTAADADIARMFADVQAVGGNVEAFARLPHATLDRLAAMQGVLAGKVDFVPLTGDEYRMNADIAQNGGEATAGVFLDRDANNRARVFINLDGKTATDAIAPHEIGHAILTSNVLDGQPRNDLRNLVNQQYGPDGVETRGREYIARMVDADLRQGVTGEAPTVLTEAEMKAMDGGKTMDDIVADRAKDPAERDRLINERVEEFRQRSIDKGEDAMDWARDEIIAETFASEAPAIDFRAIRRDAMFPRLAESVLSAGGRVLEVFGASLSSTGKLMDNPSVLFRDNPLFQDRIMQKRVREYVRSYDQYLAGLQEAGAKELRGVELARSSKPEDLARSTHVKLRDEGRGVLENDFLFQKPDGTYSLKPQKIITATENARSAQIKTLYDARKFVPVNSQEFGKRKVNGREVIGGPVLPPQFDLFTNFPKHVREFARLMERSREEGGSWDIDYNAIGTGASGRYRVTNLGNVRAIQRETVPYGWIVSKANHLLAASLDLNSFRASAMKAINKGDLGLFNNDMRQVEADLKTYLSNHRNGMPGEMTIGQQKRDMLNGLIGTGTAVQRTANPLYSDLNPRGSIRTWRVDRLNDAKPTGRTGYFFDYDKINNNRMPSALPQAGMAMPDVAVVPERFTGTGQEPNRQSRFVNPPPFFARFPIESYERGGKFFDAQSGEDLTGRSYGAGFIDVSSGKPRLFVDGDPAAQPAKSGRTYRTNLFKQKAGWKWISDNAPATSTIVSVEGGGRHVYALRADFEGGVDLARYSDKPSEPRLRPTARGELSLGNEVGRISIRGKEHRVYDGARITQRDVPRGQAMPDGPVAGSRGMPDDIVYYDPISETYGDLDMVKQFRQQEIVQWLDDVAEGAGFTWNEARQAWTSEEGKALTNEELYRSLAGDAPIERSSNLQRLIAESEFAGWKQREEALSTSDTDFFERGVVAERGSEVARLTDTPEPGERVVETQTPGLFRVFAAKVRPEDLTTDAQDINVLRDMERRNARTWQRVTAGDIDVQEAVRIGRITQNRHEGTQYDALLRAGVSKEEARLIINDDAASASQSGVRGQESSSPSRSVAPGQGQATTQPADVNRQTRGQAMPDVADIDTTKFMVAYRGGPSGKGDFPGTFVSTSQEAASQYGDVRAIGVPRGLKVLSIDDDAALQLARQYEKKYPADALNDDLAGGDEPIDLFMFPRPEWTQMLKQKGYQATQVGEDLFVFDGVKLSDKQAAVAARGQAMPDVAPDIAEAMPRVSVDQPPLAEAFSINTTGDVVTGDVIQWEEGVFTSSKKPKFLGNRTVRAVVVKDSYGSDKQQHTFTILPLASSGTQPIAAGKQTTRKGRNIYRNGTMRMPWINEDKRQAVANEKHARGDVARAARDRRKSEFW